MADLFDNINNQVNTINQGYVNEKSTSKKAGKSLDMEDFLTLMVATFQNQDIDNTADTNDMMNQMVQMSVIQAITDISKLISDSTNMTYGASLVGKEVTIGRYNSFGKMEEITGVVTGTGQLDGKQVVFIGDDTYMVSDIMAVGRMPSTDTDNKTDDKTDTDTDSDAVDKSDSVNNAGDTSSETAPVEEDDPDKVEESGSVEENGADVDSGE